MLSLANKTDEEIASLVQSGDNEIFGVLVERYEEKILRYARRFLLKSEAEDIVQEVFIKAYVNIKSFDTKRKFSPWIYRIAHNEFINAIKKKSRESLLLFFDADTIFPHPVAKETADGELSQREMKEMLEKNLEKIPSKYSEPLILFYFEELSYEEIAEILRIPISTVGVRLKRGRAALKKIIQKYE